MVGLRASRYAWILNSASFRCDFLVALWGFAYRQRLALPQGPRRKARSVGFSIKGSLVKGGRSVSSTAPKYGFSSFRDTRYA